MRYVSGHANYFCLVSAKIRLFEVQSFIPIPTPLHSPPSIIRTFETLFWPLFGVGSKGSGGSPRAMYTPPEWIPENDPWVRRLFRTGDSVKWIARWAETITGLYYLIMIIILINMLIAMMSHSFNSVQVMADIDGFSYTSFIQKCGNLRLPM